MDPIQNIRITCPYCGERFVLLVDSSVPEQQYIEDCEVCCKPMVVNATVSVEGPCRVEVRTEND